MNSDLGYKDDISGRDSASKLFLNSWNLPHECGRSTGQKNSDKGDN